MKRVMVLGIILAVLGSICGCSSSGERENNRGETGVSGAAEFFQETITIWAWDRSFNVAAANRAKEFYQQDHPDTVVRVVTMSQEDIVSKLNTGFSAGNYSELPDIVLIEDYRIGYYLTNYREQFCDLSDIADPQDFADYKTAVNYLDGKLYGIPFDSGVGVCFYRRDYIEQAGFSEADMRNLTWDRYIEIGKEVKEVCGVYLSTLDPNDIGHIRMMMQSCGVWYTDGEGNVTIAENQALKDAIEVYRKLVESETIKFIVDWDQTIKAANNGEVATAATGCWFASTLQEVPDQAGKWGIAEFPRIADNEHSRNASSIGGAGWYVLDSSESKEAALQFLGETFASNVGLMNQLIEDISLVSVMAAAQECENYQKPVAFFNDTPIFQEFWEWTSEIPRVDYGLYTYEIESMVVDAVSAILQGEAMDGVLQRCQEQIEAALSR